ncbi:MAG TPA: SDR family NAD(P)-dependent oxidoreductase [Steroidobacteraceae bacterium]|jgi:NAD(P)-dependent dehydrogenase (short-subunit alcohol dehydrogenase family)
MNTLEGKVIVVTGAGGGVGKAIAQEAARAGAKVVVNDIGVQMDGSGGSGGPSQQTADEIRLAGGIAAANTDSVADWTSAQKIVQQALDLYGRIDGIVNNAGNLRDVIFHKMTEEDFDAVPAKSSESATTKSIYFRSLGPSVPLTRARVGQCRRVLNAQFRCCRARFFRSTNRGTCSRGIRPETMSYREELRA